MNLNSSFFETIVNTVGGGIVVANKKGEIQFANPSFCNMLGYSKEELIGKTVASITFEDHITKSMDRMKEMMATPETHQKVEKVYIKADGKKLYALTRGHAQVIDGEMYLIAVISDITEQRKKRLAIEEQYKEIVENAGDIIFTTNVEGEFLYVNSCASDVTGYPKEQLLKMNYLDLISESHKLEVFKFYHKVFVDRQEKADMIFPIVNTSGDLIWLDQKMTTIWNDSKTRIMGYSALARDITKQVEMEMRLRESESHYQALFDNSVVPKRMEDFSEVKKYIEQLKKDGVKDFAKYFKDHPEEVRKCVTLVKVLEKNKQVLVLHDAKHEDELQENIDQVFTDEAYETFTDELIAIASGDKFFETETKVKTIHGEDRYIHLTWLPMPGFEESLEKVMISTIDITENVRAEKAIKESQRFYQVLFDESPIPLWLEDLSELKKVLIELKASGVKNFRKYIAGNPNEMFSLFPLIKVVEVNNEVMNLHQAKNKKQLLENFSSVFGEKSMEGLVQVISDVFDGKSSGQVESIVYTLSGEERNIILRWQPMPGSKEDFSKVLISTIDITEKVQIQKKIEESQKRLSSIFKGLGVPIFISDPDTCDVVDCNDSAVESIGFTRSQLLKKKISDLDAKHDFEYVQRSLRRCFSEGLVEGQTAWKNSKGEIREITVRNSLINFGGKPRILSACLDITQLKRLNAENERFRLIMNDAPFAVYIYDVESERFIDTNGGAVAQLGYSKAEILELKLEELEYKEKRPSAKARKDAFNKLLISGETLYTETIHTRKDGSLFPVKLTVNVKNFDGRPIAVASAFDNTQYQEAEQKLKVQNEELLAFQEKLSKTNEDLKLQIDLKKKAQKGLVNSEERERKRIAQELHDGLGQRLTAAKLSLGAIQNSKVLEGGMEIILKDSIQIIEGSMSEVRQISHNLLPSVLIDFGLSDALEKLCEETSELTGVEVSFDLKGALDGLDDHISTVLYRITQEAVNNAVKYSKSETISVKIKSNKKSLSLEIRDKGQGFDAEKVKRGMGLNNMAERAELINAQFSMESVVNKGTTIKVIYYF